MCIRDRHEILPVSFSELMDILRNQLYVRYGSEDTEVLEVCYKNIVDLYHDCLLYTSRCV